MYLNGIEIVQIDLADEDTSYIPLFKMVIQSKGLRCE
jgi:hypothetical protein